MNWGIEDVAAAALLIGLAALAVLVIRKTVKTKLPRFLMMAGVVLIFMATWAHLAVGIF